MEEDVRVYERADGQPNDQRKRITERCRCCVCGGPLTDVIPVYLYRTAKWKWPTWQIVKPRKGSLGEDLYEGALAFVCDVCVKQAGLDPEDELHDWEWDKNEVKYAVEWTEELAEVRYHPLANLRKNWDELDRAAEKLEKMSAEEFEELAEELRIPVQKLRDIAYTFLLDLLPKTMKLGRVAVCRKCGKGPALTDGLCLRCIGVPLPPPIRD